MPNSGKSALLNRLTGAGARVADYLMTTIDPVIGVLDHDWRQYRVVEIPATWTRSDGRKFGPLKHAHRAAVVAMVLDGSTGDVTKEHGQLVKALEESDAVVEGKPRIVVFNKVDLLDESGPDRRVRMEDFPGVQEIHFVSAATGEGVDKLISSLVEVVDAVGRKIEVQESEEVPVLRPTPIGSRISVKKEEGAYVVDAGALERLVRGTDISDWEARMQLMSLLEKAGVHQALQKAGVKEGDTVRIGNAELEWT